MSNSKKSEDSEITIYKLEEYMEPLEEDVPSMGTLIFTNEDAAVRSLYYEAFHYLYGYVGKGWNHSNRVEFYSWDSKLIDYTIDGKHFHFVIYQDRLREEPFQMDMGE